MMIHISKLRQLTEKINLLNLGFFVECIVWNQGGIFGSVLNSKKMAYTFNDPTLSQYPSVINMYVPDKKICLNEFFSVLLHECGHVIDEDYELDKKNSEIKAWFVSYYMAKKIPVLGSPGFFKVFNKTMKEKLVTYNVSDSEMVEIETFIKYI